VLRSDGPGVSTVAAEVQLVAIFHHCHHPVAHTAVVPLRGAVRELAVGAENTRCAAVSRKVELRAKKMSSNADPRVSKQSRNCKFQFPPSRIHNFNVARPAAQQVLLLISLPPFDTGSMVRNSARSSRLNGRSFICIHFIAMPASRAHKSR